MPYAEDPSATTRLKKANGLALAVLLGTIYLATFLILPRDGFWINDNGCKFIQLQGLINTGYGDFSIPWPGKNLDPSYTCNPLPEPFGHVIDGKLYGTFSPIFPLLSSFPYRLFGNTGLYLLPLLGGLLTLPAVWFLAGRLSPGPHARRVAQPLAVLVTALGTPMWFYSVTFWEHTPAVCLITWSVLCCIHYIADGSIRRLAATAALCGGSVYFRDELYLFGLVIAAMVTVFSRQRGRYILVFAVVFVLALVPLWMFQWFALGHPLGHHFRTGSLLDISLAQHLSARWSTAHLLLLNVDLKMWLSIVLAAPFLALFLLNPRTSQRVFGWAVPACAFVGALAGAIVLARHLSAESPIWWLVHTNGLFATSPILLLAFVRTRQAVNDAGVRQVAGIDDRLSRTVWTTVLLYVVVYVLSAPEAHSGGIHWGCRYLLPVFPLIGVLAATTVAAWWTSHGRRSKVGQASICLAMALSMCLQVYSLTLLYRRKQFSSELNRVVAQRPEEVILASGWLHPQELAHSFFDKQVFLIQDPQATASLISNLRKAGTQEALYVSSPPTPDAGRGASMVFDDRSLRFIAVELLPVRLTE